MLSKEEKEAIEILKKLQKKTPYIIWGDGTPYNKNNQIQTILNLIDRLQKEIEDLKETNNDNAEKSLLNDIFIKKNYISKDKIREKLDKYRKKIEKLHSQELWNEPEDSIKDFKYNHYLEAYKEILEEK